MNPTLYCKVKCKNPNQTCPWCGNRDTYAEADLVYGIVTVETRDIPPTGFRP